MSTQRFVFRAAAIALAWAASAAFGQAQKAAEPAASPPPANGPIVKVRQGEAQGIVADGVAVFKGLPFAAPPLGDLRWRDPQVPAKWRTGTGRSSPKPAIPIPPAALPGPSSTRPMSP